MKIQLLVKQVAISLSATGFLWSNAAFAQSPPATPVSTSVHLSGSCAKCDLSRRVMPGMSLQGANFMGSDFSQSNLSGANFDRANLNNASFYKAYLMRVKGEQVNLNKAVLRGTTLSDVHLVSSNFISADLHKSDMTGGDFSKSDFTKAKLKSADAMGAIFISANFTRARLDHADFTGSDFTGTQFINTKFGDAIVKDAKFNGADFSGADLVDITGLEQSQLDGTCGSKTTKLPEGYSMHVCRPKDEILAGADMVAEMPEPALIVGAPRSPRPNMATRIPRRGSMISIRSTELDEIMRGIDGAMNDLPMGSPTRVKLEQSRRKLQAVQAQRD